ncbi:MAG TPA: AAA family ATPase, partial [Candidatus Methylomirabilis sp.]|nr:AAA family ATPase [Candidatus Methylomirabilis sp.]
ALAQLLHGVHGRKGFMLLTGEVGTGKTTLLQDLIRRLDDRTAVALITNSMLGFEGLLEYMLEDLGVGKVGQSHAQRLFALQNFLVERHRAGQGTVLILDEAQDLDVPTLEQVRLLSNFETPTEKILQILLVGQPELRVKLDLPELRQLKQRIGLRCTIPPLALDEVGHYIRTRLRVAGSPDLRLFTEPAIERIARYSGGIPRLINTACDHGLLFAYADKVRRIDRDIVDQVIQYLDDGEPQRRRAIRPRLPGWRMTPLRWSVLGACTAAAAGLAAAHSGASSLADLASSARALFRL